MDNVGTLKKYSVNITCDGFSMDTDTWNVHVWNMSNGHAFEDFGRDSDGGTVGNTVKVGGVWNINVDTFTLGAGVYMARVDIDVADSDQLYAHWRHITKVCQLDEIGGLL